MHGPGLKVLAPRSEQVKQSELVPPLQVIQSRSQIVQTNGDADEAKYPELQIQAPGLAVSALGSAQVKQSELVPALQVIQSALQRVQVNGEDTAVKY